MNGKYLKKIELSSSSFHSLTNGIRLMQKIKNATQHDRKKRRKKNKLWHHKNLSQFVVSLIRRLHSVWFFLDIFFLLVSHHFRSMRAPYLSVNQDVSLIPSFRQIVFAFLLFLWMTFIMCSICKMCKRLPKSVVYGFVASRWAHQIYYLSYTELDRLCEWSRMDACTL